MEIGDIDEFCRNLLNACVYSELSEANFSMSFASMLYLGFDHKRMVEVMKTKVKSVGLGSEEAFKDIRRLGIIGADRGTKINELIGTFKGELKNYLMKMRARYHIVDKARSNIDITMSRIMRVAVPWIMKLLNNEQVTLYRVVTPSMVAPGFPRALCLSTAGNMIPLSKAWTDVKELITFSQAFLYHQFLFETTKNPRNQMTQKRFQNLKEYLKMQITSNIYSQKEKIELLSSLKLTDSTSHGLIISDGIRNAMIIASDKWENLRGRVKLSEITGEVDTGESTSKIQE